MKFLQQQNHKIPEITVEEAYRLCEAGTLLVDVREPDEIAAGCAQGCCCIPLGELENRLAEIPRDQPVLLICRSGKRSLSAAELLHSKGYADVKSVTGGFLEWESQGLPI